MDATLIAPYVIPVAFGRRPHPRETADINAATGSGVDLGETSFLLTAAHVMEAALAPHARPGRATAGLTYRRDRSGA
jgi:hypothetical protein